MKDPDLLKHLSVLTVQPMTQGSSALVYNFVFEIRTFLLCYPITRSYSNNFFRFHSRFSGCDKVGASVASLATLRAKIILMYEYDLSNFIHCCEESSTVYIRKNPNNDS